MANGLLAMVWTVVWTAVVGPGHTMCLWLVSAVAEPSTSCQPCPVGGPRALAPALGAALGSKGAMAVELHRCKG